MAGRKTYPLETIERGLMAMVMSNDNARRAEALLKTQKINVPPSTLRDWVKKHPELYYDLKEQQLPALRKQHEQALEDSLSLTHETYLKAIRYTSKQLDEGIERSGAAAAKNLAASYKEMVTSLRLSRGEATEIISTNGDDLEARITKLLGSVPGSAEEIKDAQEVPQLGPSKD